MQHSTVAAQDYRVVCAVFMLPCSYSILSCCSAFRELGLSGARSTACTIDYRLESAADRMQVEQYILTEDRSLNQRHHTAKASHLGYLLLPAHIGHPGRSVWQRKRHYQAYQRSRKRYSDGCSPGLSRIRLFEGVRQRFSFQSTKRIPAASTQHLQ